MAFYSLRASKIAAPEPAITCSNSVNCFW